jgi:hypothetical protein
MAKNSSNANESRGGYMMVGKREQRPIAPSSGREMSESKKDGINPLYNRLFLSLMSTPYWGFAAVLEGTYHKLHSV